MVNLLVVIPYVGNVPAYSGNVLACGVSPFYVPSLRRKSTTPVYFPACYHYDTPSWLCQVLTHSGVPPPGIGMATRHTVVPLGNVTLDT